jgi:Smg protein
MFFSVISVFSVAKNDVGFNDNANYFRDAMFDILMYLFESYFHAGNYPDSEKLSLKLTAAGFEDEDIRRTLDWLSGLKQLSQANYPESINLSGARCYAALETQRISAEALGLLTFWEQCRIVTPVEREMILDRAVTLGRDHLSVDKIKLITLMVLWNQHEDLDPLIIEDLLTPSDFEPAH